jgi:hypothetical protein
MIVASTFNLAAKSTQELKGLYLRIFNEISNPRLSPNERRMAIALLVILRIELSMRPTP